jgi:hypothetical protein
VAGPESENYAERLKALRRERFAGRTQEISQILNLLEPGESARLVYIHGLGGVGKSCLLNRCADLAAERDHICLRLDARNIPPEPPAIEALLGLQSGDGLVQPLLESSSPALLLIDSLEFWRPLENWLAEDLLTSLPLHIRVVLAGRFEPDPGWRYDPGWSALMQVVELKNFERADVSEYLVSRGIDTRELDAMVEQTRCYPLAVAMLADQINAGRSDWLKQGSHLEMTGELVRRLVHGQSSIAQRQTLYVSAVAAETTETILARLIPGEDATSLFAWLGQLSCMLPGMVGVFPHDMVRDLLVLDMKVRQPGRYEFLAGGLFELEVSAALTETSLSWQEAAARSLRGLFALREVPALSGFVADHGSDGIYLDRALSCDLASIIVALESAEGPESAAHFRHWHSRQPEALVVMRDADRNLLGFCLYLDLCKASHADRLHDPVTDALWQHACRIADPAADTHFHCARFWMHQQCHQQPSVVATAVLSLCAGHVVTNSRQIINALVSKSPNPGWRAFAELAAIDCFPELIPIGDSSYEIIQSDWRQVDRLSWVRQFAGRLTNGLYRGLPEYTSTAPDRCNLGDAEFSNAVRQALKDLHDSHRLSSNPLVQLLQATDSSKLEPDGLEKLRTLLRSTIDRLSRQPATGRYASILRRTYLEPTATQQLAADSLSLAYSTYRRLLAHAREILVTELRRQI